VEYHPAHPAPARSSDLNYLDLTYFRALQSSRWVRGFARDIDQLIVMVEGAYWDFKTIKIGKGYVTLASCINKALLCNGDNTYTKLKKDKMIREGT
jgi:hypothetical protein